MNKLSFLKPVLFFILFTVFSFFAVCQTITFEKTYGGAGDDEGESVIPTLDGGYMLAGTTGSFGSGGSDMYAVKTDSAGNGLWTKTYGGGMNDYCYSAVQTTDSGYAFFGWTQDSINGPAGLYMVKTDSNGDVQWEKTYGGLTGGRGGRQTSDGGYIMAGEITVNGYRDIYLVKTNSIGDTLWTRRHGGNYDDVPLDLIEVSSGGYIISGWTKSCGSCNLDGYLVSTSINGDTLWTKVFTNSLGDTYCRGIEQTIDNGFIIVGSTPGPPQSYNNIYLIKLNAGGSVNWSKKINPAFNETLSGGDIKQTRDGKYIIVGRIFNSATNFDAIFLKTDSSGNELWRKVFVGSVFDDLFKSIDTTKNDGGFIALGTAYNTVGSYNEMYLVKTDSVGIVTFINEIYSSDKHLFIYPNPCTIKSTLQFKNPGNEEYLLKVYDLTGREVYSNTIKGEEAELLASQFEKGYYIVRLYNNTGDFNTAKIIIQ